MRSRSNILNSGFLVALLVAASTVAFLDCSSGTKASPKLISDAGSSGGQGGAATQDSGVTYSCTATFSSSGTATAAAITVDSSTVVNTFVPKLMFGINSGYFVSQEDSTNTQAQVQAAGNFFIRYPGGSSSDDYHWNGTGSYDPSQHWVPSDTAFSPGFPGSEVFRGTTSVNYSIAGMLTDGDRSTRWLSNVDTDFPDAQWVYIDFGSALTASSLTIDWSTPYATSFRVQSWNMTSSWAQPPYQITGGSWQTTSAGTVVGTGGTQTVTFTPVRTQFLRVLMTASSDGSTGAYSIAELTAFNGNTQVTNNVATTAQSATTASSTDPANTPTPQSNFDFEAFMAYAHAFSPPADPVITVNVGTGTPQEAAAWVHYANLVKQYGIKYWQIGNEMEGNWETGGPLNAKDYVRRYIEYYDAMKAADPSIVILGPVSGGINEGSNLEDGNLFIQDFIAFLHQAGKDNYLNGIDFHWYPNWNPVTDATALATPAQLGQFAGNLKSWLATNAITGNVPVFLTEYNIGIGSPNTPVYTNQLVNGLWVAHSLGEFIRYFGNGGGTNLWNLISGWTTNDATDSTAGDLGYLQHTRNSFRYQEHASYWALQLMSSDWAISGDTRTHQLVASSSDQAALATYADLRPDGALTLAVVNSDEAAAYSANIAIAPFTVGTAADVWTFDKTNYVWETSVVPYHAEPDTAPTHKLTCGAAASTPFTFAPASITVFRFATPGSATAVIPDAGVVSSSSTITPSGTTLIDDMSNTAGAQIQLAPQHAGSTPGYWYTYIGGGSASDLGSITPTGNFYYTLIGTAPGATIASPPDAGTYQHAACVWGQTPATQYAYAAEGFDFELAPGPGGANVAQYVDISSHKGLQFWVYNALGTSSTIHLEVNDKESDPDGGICGKADASNLDQCNGPVFVDLTIPSGWSMQRVPFSDLASNPYWGYPQPTGGDMTTAYAVNFEIDQPQDVSKGGGPMPFNFCITALEFFD